MTKTCYEYELGEGGGLNLWGINILTTTTTTTTATATATALIYMKYPPNQQSNCEDIQIELPNQAIIWVWGGYIECHMNIVIARGGGTE